MFHCIFLLLLPSSCIVFIVIFLLYLVLFHLTLAFDSITRVHRWFLLHRISSVPSFKTCCQSFSGTSSVWFQSRSYSVLVCCSSFSFSSLELTSTKFFVFEFCFYVNGCSLTMIAYCFHYICASMAFFIHIKEKPFSYDSHTDLHQGFCMLRSPKKNIQYWALILRSLCVNIIHPCHAFFQLFYFSFCFSIASAFASNSIQNWF